MINLNDRYLLFIEPSSNRTLEPVIDDLTRKVTASLRASEHGGCYFGTHGDACRRISDSSDRILTNGLTTNTLCVHYIAFHRWEVPQSEIDKINLLDDGQAEPTDEELWP